MKSGCKRTQVTPLSFIVAKCYLYRVEGAAPFNVNLQSNVLYHSYNDESLSLSICKHENKWLVFERDP